MNNQDNQANQLHIDIALIKKDIKTIEKFFERLEDNIDSLSELPKTIALQQQALKNTNERLDHLNEKFITHEKTTLESREALKEQLNDFHKEFKTSVQKQMEEASKIHAEFSHESKTYIRQKVDETHSSIKTISENIEKRLKDFETRLRSLESSKWYLLGAIAVVSILLYKIDLASLFG